MLCIRLVLCMEQVKRKWRTIGLPSPLFRRIMEVIKWSGHMSISEYARFAIQERLKFDEAHAEEQKMIESEVKERLE